MLNNIEVWHLALSLSIGFIVPLVGFYLGFRKTKDETEKDRLRIRERIAAKKIEIFSEMFYKSQTIDPPTGRIPKEILENFVNQLDHLQGKEQDLDWEKRKLDILNKLCTKSLYVSIILIVLTALAVKSLFSIYISVVILVYFVVLFVDSYNIKDNIRGVGEDAILREVLHDRS